MSAPVTTEEFYSLFRDSLGYCMAKGVQRYGQVLFNTLLYVRPDLAEKLRGSDLDPFYKNQKEIDPRLWVWLQENW